MPDRIHRSEPRSVSRRGTCGGSRSGRRSERFGESPRDPCCGRRSEFRSGVRRGSRSEPSRPGCKFDVGRCAQAQFGPDASRRLPLLACPDLAGACSRADIPRLRTHKDSLRGSLQGPPRPSLRPSRDSSRAGTLRDWQDLSRNASLRCSLLGSPRESRRAFKTKPR